MSNILTVGDVIPKPTSVFLAGPIERREDGKEPILPQWRKEASQWLSTYINFDFYIFSPEWGQKPKDWTYEKQVDWEIEALNQATAILCWIPRQLPLLPAFTTNVEVGEWLHNPKLIVGAPPETPHTRYIKYRREKLGLSWATSLESCAIYTSWYLEGLRSNNHV